MMLTHLGAKILTTDRLTLRRFAADDAPAMFETWAQDPDVTRYMTWEPHPDVHETERIIAMWLREHETNPAFYHWALELTETQTLIGSLGIQNLSDRDRNGELGYCIAKPFWGRGLVTEAVGRVIEFLFLEVGLHRIYAKHAIENPASGRVMEKCGMTYEATLREHIYLNAGEWTDVKVYGILNPAHTER